ncbi:zinc-binding dehydrogenase [Pseudonocardia thermophila]|uniref:zinc-binding dehydrogenase n=1 Tax=Pseudonocardia thermophila TaxID=1848 RepID=UPI001160FD44|nr:zinc-binding dehydrogenase [Pseudonocardia thermophila]
MGTGSGQLVNAAFFVQSGGPLLVEKVSAHPPGPRDVVVRMRAAGICHTDATVLAAGALPTPPAILGHEGAGVVEWVGPEVSEFRVGDRVLGLTISRCGRCANCRRGTPYLCETAGPYAEPRAVRSDGTELVTKNGLGTFAETMTVPPERLIAVRTDLPDEQLALVGCAITTGYGAVVNSAAVQPGQTVVVIGCGGVGQAVVQAARIAGAERVIAVEPVAAKRELALRLGATDVIDPTSGQPLAEAVRALGVAGADHAFDTVGRTATVRDSYTALRRGGTVVVIGIGDIRTDYALPGTLVVEAKQVAGCVFGNADVDRDVPRILELAAEGRLDIASMIDKVIDLQSAPAALDALHHGDGTGLRTVIAFS